MNKILKRDLLGSMSDQEVMSKHGIGNHDILRRLWMVAKGMKVRVNKEI